MVDSSQKALVVCEKNLVSDLSLKFSSLTWKISNENEAFALTELKEKDFFTIRNYFNQNKTVGLVPLSTIKAMFFDMDATVIEEESLVSLAKGMPSDVIERIEKITEASMRGELSFEESLFKRVKFLRGLKVDKIEQVLANLTITNGIHEVIRFGVENGIESYLVSGGFYQLARPIAKQLGFAGVFANNLVEKNGELTGQLDGPLVDEWGKASFLKQICRKKNIDTYSTMAVGDGANDRYMLAISGKAVGFRPKSILNPLLHLKISNPSLSVLVAIIKRTICS